MSDMIGFGSDDLASDPPPHSRPRRSLPQDEPDVFSSLFDFSFTHLITPRIIKGAYALLVGTLTLLAMGLAIYSYSEQEWLLLSAIPVIYFNILFGYRILAEYLIHEFHSSEDIWAIRQSIEVEPSRLTPNALKVGPPSGDGSLGRPSPPPMGDPGVGRHHGADADPVGASESVLHEFEVATAAGFPGEHRMLSCHCAITEGRLLVDGRSGGGRREALFCDITRVRMTGSRRSPALRVEMAGRAIVLYGLRDFDPILQLLSDMLPAGLVERELE